MRAKRVVTSLLALALLLALAPAARADVLWEPDNGFYERHSDQCTYVGRGYLANGPDGFVTLWNAPNGSEVEAQYENGEALWVYWLWEDWGCISRWEDGKETSGWVEMDDLALQYDYIAFAEDYADQIKDYGGEFADYDGDAACVNLFEYPGAPAVKESRDVSDWYGALDDLTGKSHDGNSYIQSVFVDENGLTWGYIAYWYGHVNAWFCLDEPDGESFPVRQVEESEIVSPQTPVMPVKGAVSAALPWVLVAAVVLITAALLWPLRKKRRK